jgi:hypothetical protein
LQNENLKKERKIELEKEEEFKTLLTFTHAFAALDCVLDVLTYTVPAA